MNRLLGLLLMAALFIYSVFILALYLQTPVVYESWGTKSCVRVEDPSGRHDCQNLPAKYMHRLVE